LVGDGEENTAAGDAQPAVAAVARRETIMKAWILALFFLLPCAGLALAQEQGEPAPGPRSWQSLSPPQQQVLQNFQGKWDSLSPEKQQALARGSQRYLNMSPQERAGAQERFKQWHALTPEQRDQVRQRWRQFQALPPEERQHVREAYRRFNQLPAQRQQELRQRWNQMSPEQRRGALQRPPGQRMQGRPAPMRSPPPRRFSHW
jgi:Protein of unknown function (DUF3106)